MTDQIETEVLAALYSHNNKVIAPDQIVTLVRGNLKEEQGIVFAVNPKGEPRYSGDGVRLGATEVVQEFLQENPHFIKY